MAVNLYDYQIEAIKKLKNGSILCGGVGSGKSITALAYYLYDCDGSIKMNGSGEFRKMRCPRDLYIITTARKRDTLEWEKECSRFVFTDDRSISHSGIKVTIDSWNNIKRYINIYDCFFIFDEQRVSGSGAWVKAFLRISNRNHWILLSATPGDKWTDYIPVFVANHFYKNKTDFCTQHCIYSRFATYPKIDRYVGTKRLKDNRDSILVIMKDNRKTERIYRHVVCNYDREKYRTIMKDRWDPYENEPIRETGKLLYLIRRVVNSDESRIYELDKIIKQKKKVIIFYNFSYELNALREYLNNIRYTYAEWNGEKHENIPTGNKWVYLVQYVAGGEAWECTTTDTIVFYSQNYSYRIMEQAAGRIDRINTPYKKLYYYTFHSNATIDRAIHQCLEMKRDFNEKMFIQKEK